MGKPVEKFWSGSTNFTVSETFPSVSAALKQTVPSDAAVYEIDTKTISFEFTRIKEKNNGDNPLLSSGKTDPGKREGKKVSELKNHET
tara:strand:- start:2006 stop:2269 length:264 start_codon:yes stop_codon:yes gene_type:complete